MSKQHFGRVSRAVLEQWIAEQHAELDHDLRMSGSALYTPEAHGGAMGRAGRRSTLDRLVADLRLDRAKIERTATRIINQSYAAQEHS